MLSELCFLSDSFASGLCQPVGLSSPDPADLHRPHPGRHTGVPAVSRRCWTVTTRGLLGWIPTQPLKLAAQDPVGLPRLQPARSPCIVFHLRSSGVPSWMKNLPYFREIDWEGKQKVIWIKCDELWVAAQVG